MTLRKKTWDQRLYMVSEPWETHSLMLKAKILHLTNLVAAGIEPQTFLVILAEHFALGEPFIAKLENVSMYTLKASKISFKRMVNI